MSLNGGSERLSILAIIVLYKCKIEDSPAFRSLCSAAAYCPEAELKILVFDNSPEPLPKPILPASVLYVSMATNEGLAGPYNQALMTACREGFEWLLTLDQDTILPNDFLADMIAIALRQQRDESVAAIVPQLTSGAVALSPVNVHWLHSRAVPRGFTGLNSSEVYALNSAALLRVTALRELGGFSTEFWLDQLDLWLHHQLYRAGKRVFIAGNVQIEHKLSLLDYKSLSPARYGNFLEAESAFFDQYKGLVANFLLTATLLVRYCKQKMRGDPVSIWQLTREHLRRRLFQSKMLRLGDWKNKVQMRLQRSSGTSFAEQSPFEKPSVSVCMATYCGEEFVSRQITSILRQLSPADELIIVDDASRDRTGEIIQNLHDPHIHFERHATNQGVLRTFEDAIRRAEGEILFLSDQDDLWAANKISTILHAFELHPEADIIVSDATLIDDEGNTLAESYYAQMRRFRPGILANLLHCSYLGCTMAFRRKVRSRILPFPQNADVFHDLWIGTANALAGGKAIYLDTPLVFYRRHRGNATGNQRLALRRQIRIRWDLCRSLAKFWFRSHRDRQSMK
jgi:GT2 family glycosyltransferase